MVSGEAGARPPLPKSWFTRATSLQVMLAWCLVAELAVIPLDVWGMSLLSRLIEGDLPSPDALSRFDDLSTGLTLARAGLVLITGVLFITWLYQLHHSDRMDPAALQHSSGWAIGGWFVPVLNLWRPLQMVLDVRRGARGAAGGSEGVAVYGWWWLVVGSWVFARATRILLPEDTDPQYAQHFREFLATDVLVSLPAAAAAVLAVWVVRDTTRLVQARQAAPVPAAGPPPSPAP